MREHFDASGNGKNTTSTPFGCFLDHLGIFDYRLFNVSPREIPSITRAFSSGRIDYHFRWEGASYNLDAACISSSTAIFLACSALIARDCDTTVAGRGSILAAPRDFAGLSKGDFLSATGNCKTFHDSADGYCRTEGVGVVVLKRLEDALAENDSKRYAQSRFFRKISRYGST